MAYLRCGQLLPSGNKSRAFVTGNHNSLVHAEKGGSIPYQNLRDWFNTLSDEEVKENICQGLDLHGEPLDFLCIQLFKERDKGEWKDPFDYEFRHPTRK